MNLRAATLRPRRPWIVVAGVLCALVVADHLGLLLVRGPDDMTAYHGVRATVSRVIDGALIEIDVPDRPNGRGTTRVRLWGVNAPRPAGTERHADPLAADALELATRLCRGRQVVLSLETHRTRGPMGAVMAHVGLPGGLCLNERMLAAGLARADERWPHARLTRYAEVERAARHRDVAIWATQEARLAD